MSKLWLTIIFFAFPVLLFAQFDDEDDYSDASENGIYKVVKNDKELCGLIKTDNNQLVIPYQYNRIMLEKIPAQVTLEFVNVIDASGKEGVVSIKTKKLLIPCKYAQIKNEFHDFYPYDGKTEYIFCGFNATKDNNVTDYYSPSGKLIYSTKKSISEVTTVSQKDNIYIGKLDIPDSNYLRGYFLFNLKTSKLIQSRETDYFTEAGDNNAVIALKKKFGVINYKTGKSVIDMQYDSISHDYFGDCFKVIKKNEVAVFDNNGKIKIPFGVYSTIGEFFNAESDPNKINVACANKNGKYGFIDVNNNVVIPFDYDGIQNREEGFNETTYMRYRDSMWVSKNNKFGLINYKGETIIPFQYDKLQFSNSRFKYVTEDEKSDYFSFYYNKVMKDKKWGCITENGKILVPIEYDKAFEYLDTMWLSKNGKLGCIDRNLKVLVNFKLDTLVYKKVRFNKKGVIAIKNGQEIQMDNYGDEKKYRSLFESIRSSDKESFYYSVKSASPYEKAQALYYAIYDINTEMVKLLLENKPELKLVNDNKPPIYHIAMRAGGAMSDQVNKCIDILKLLIKYGADPNQRGFSNETAIIVYFTGYSTPNSEFVRILLNAGADVNLKNSYGDDVFDKIKSKYVPEDIKAMLEGYRK